MVKNLPVNVGDTRDTGSTPGLGRSSGEGHGNPLQYPCLEKPMDRGALWAMVHRVAKSQIQLKQLHTHARTGCNITCQLLRVYARCYRLIVWVPPPICVLKPKPQSDSAGDGGFEGIVRS